MRQATILRRVITINVQSEPLVKQTKLTSGQLRTLTVSVVED